MNLVSFDADLFGTRVTFSPPQTATGSYSAPAVSPASGGVSLPAYVEPATDTGDRREAHRVPEGAKRWSVFTPTEPPAATDWLVTWNARLLRVTVRPSDQTGGAGLLWRTECEEVS